MKYKFECTKCGHIVNSFVEWFEIGQKCLKCGEIYVKAIYDYENVDFVSLLTRECVQSMWHYFDILPLERKENITTLGEGVLPIDRWQRVENIVKDIFNIECEIRVIRNDNNPGTGTFKDLAGTMVSSVLKENNIKNYVVASTGNIAAVFSRYLAINDINLYAFLPKDSSSMQEAEIRSNGGVVYKVDGDYHKAKILAKKFAKKHNFLLAATGIDPTRIEAKKIMIYEILRQLKREPDVYIQALSGGTGPIGVYKGSKELMSNNLLSKLPKLILIQSNKCAPMADAYQNAKKNDFKGNWFLEYPIYNNPDTKITTIATGNPTLYPYVAKIVKDSEGDIIGVDEEFTKLTTKLIAVLETVKIGPAAGIAIEGLFKAVRKNLIKDGDLVIVNIGEGAKRTPEYILQFALNKVISDIDECEIKTLEDEREKVIKHYKKIIENI
ncbi:threonine synthase [Nitrosophilus labii]|uniref:threonine synthase n=1 Tax=Nitrosophilus labii TaxID=2706014 RepID=UPI00165751A5|nr:pyridoxal-phosphate dependent enzyme [Nitrosophilus labii]